MFAVERPPSDNKIECNVFDCARPSVPNRILTVAISALQVIDTYFEWMDSVCACACVCIYVRWYSDINPYTDVR